MCAMTRVKIEEMWKSCMVSLVSDLWLMKSRIQDTQRDRQEDRSEYRYGC